MKRLFGSFMLLGLLLLAACSTTPNVTAPDDAASVAGFRFDIDPAGEAVAVTALGPGGVGTQQLDPKTQLVINSAGYSFGPNNTLTIKASFKNATTNLGFSSLSFSPSVSPRAGNYLSSSAPQVTKADLGGDGMLSTGETTSTLVFTVKHKGQKFSSTFDAYATVTQENKTNCGANGTFRGNATVRTQADINALRGCTKIDGNFYIDTTAQTLDFSPLDSLRVITKSFKLADRSISLFASLSGKKVNPNLTAVSGFDNLERVGNLYIVNNPSLISIPQFPKLGGDVFDFVIADNPRLASMPEFNVLVNVEGAFIIDHNASLTAVSGFDALKTAATFFDYSESARPWFSIADNASLASITGFGRLDKVAGYGFTVSGNPSLASLTGFGSLESIRKLDISDNLVLTTIPEFGALEFLGEDADLGFAGGPALAIRSNPSLPAVSGFARLSSVMGNIFITNNASLTIISGFESLTSFPYSRDERPNAGRVEISGNASLSSISGFTSLTSAAGIVSVINHNSAFDCSIPSESLLPFLPADESVGNLVDCAIK